MILLAIAVIIIALGYAGYKVTSGGAKAALPIIILILLLFGGYIGAAAYFRWPPWKSKDPTQGSACQDLGSAASPCTNGQVCASSGNGNYCVGQCYSGAGCNSGNCASNVPFTLANGSQISLNGICACGGNGGQGCNSPATICLASGEVPAGSGSGWCMPVTPCSGNSDCSNGQSCINDTCTPTSCPNGVSDCLGGWYCDSNKICRAPCTSNANCPTNANVSCQQPSGSNPPPGQYCLPT